MAQITVTRDMGATTDTVWEALADLGSHAEWMKDAEGIVFKSEQTRGPGTVMEVETRVGPLRTLDVLEVTGWDEGTSIDVIHKGLVKGTGTLSVRPSAQGSLVKWDERLTFPWWLGGPLTAFLAKPILGAIWRGNLRRLEENLSSP